MKKRTVKILLGLLTVGGAIMGIYDGGDITAAVMSGLLLLAVMRDKEENEDAV